ncbi:hypothetical protein YYY_04025 [Anaplasma phagocytophilum str. Dog2]|nr:hypothetical protein WSQ_04040 [Anaplasma phagocytophilum str. JM]AGR82032.1 hypothetical protein YYY_04025 [Anaplasma phagocytophilum str. Dog2]PLC09845.1 hypothetical protein C0V68_04540 [Anaplasma phagocytophilum]
MHPADGTTGIPFVQSYCFNSCSVVQCNVVCYLPLGVTVAIFTIIKPSMQNYVISHVLLNTGSVKSYRSAGV